MTLRQLPIACSLEGQSRTTRQAEWSEFLTETLIERRAISGGVALKVKPSPDAVTRLTNLIELERRCCPWIHWSIKEDDVLSVEVTSSREDGARLLTQWFGVSSA